MSKLWIAPFLLLSLVLAACGFSPVYGTGSFSDSPASVEVQQAGIAIDIIPNREGQQLRNLLIDRLNRGGYPDSPVYQLAITELGETIRDLDVTIDSDTTRGQLRLTTQMRLIDTQTKEAVLQRDLRAITSFNILAGEFSNRVSEQNARENAISDIADQIVLQIGLYLKRR